MKTLEPHYMTKEALANLALQVQSILWFDADKDMLDPDKEWDEETIELVAERLDAAGLRPEDFTPSLMEAPQWFLRGKESHPVEDWRREVANGDTLLGYQDWVIHKVEAE